MSVNSHDLEPLTTFLRRIPSVGSSIGSGHLEGGLWWAKFTLDIAHPLAWSVVQELGFVLNYLSLEERLPTVFMPVSPPPYLNGGPAQFLSWVIESTVPDFSPALCVEWLEGRLPRPVEDENEWQFEDNKE